MATYESYKDSGVTWLGQIPSHWEIKRAKTIFVRHKRPVRKEDEIVTCFRDGQVTLRKNRRIEGFTNAAKEFGYQGIRKGDLVIHEMDAFAGAVGVSDSDGKSTPVYSVCTTRIPENSEKYYAHIIKVMANLGFIQSLSKGIRERSTAFSYDIFGPQLLPIPPAEEQEAIVAYLGKVTTEIDRAIEAQQKMIEALNERKQIIITRAVTRGLNPDAPLRDSGIDWLGPIPSHWDFCKLKYFIRIKSGDSISNTQLSDNGKYLVYGGGEPLGRYNQYNINKGNIVIGRVGARCGCITPIYEKAWATDNALVVSCEGIDYQYLIYCLIAADLNKIASSNAQPLLTGTKVKNTYIAIPNLAEQKEIVSHVGKATKSLYLSIANCERMISLLQERKQIIINEVVTGKKKVI